MTVDSTLHYLKSLPMAWLLIGILAIGTIFSLTDYIIADSNLFIGLAVLPFVIRTDKNNRSIRYLIPVVIVTILAFYYPLKSILFVLFVLTLILIIESFYGKLSLLPFILLITISPLFKFSTSLFSFPVRLWLSETTAECLSLLGMSATEEGNIILLNGEEFSVDPACAGLNMLATSVLIAILILAFTIKKNNKEYSSMRIISFIAITILLNIIGNLTRILTLVVFKIASGNALHDIVGIFSLIIYVIIPIYFLADKVIRPNSDVSRAKEPKYVHYILPINLVMVASTLLVSIFAASDVKQGIPITSLNILGFKESHLPYGVTKLEDKNSLIYLKPLTFYCAEHNPTICWTGSGYEFSNIKEATYNGITIYQGILKKGKDILHTAWWFDNGKIRTVNQLQWRTKAITDDPFFLINVTSSAEEELESEINKLFTSNILSKSKG